MSFSFRVSAYISTWMCFLPTDVLPKCKVQPHFVGFLSVDGVCQVVITIFKMQT